MQINSHNIAYRQYSVWRRRGSSSVWLACAFAAVVAVSVIVAGALLSVQVPRTSTYLGTLRLAREPVLFYVPDYGIVGEILVSPGDEVRAGQTVISLDRAKMQTVMKELSAELRVQAYLQTCLNTFTEAPLNPKVDPAAKSSWFEAQENCRTTHTTKRVEIAELKRAADTLRAEQDLVEDYLALIQREHSEMDAARLRNVLAVKLLLNRLERQAGEIAGRMATLEAASLEERSARIQVVGDRIKEVTDQIRQLKLLVEVPRLQSPVDALITHVKSADNGGGRTRNWPAIEAVALDGEIYELELSTDADAPNKFKSGDPVKLRIMGFERSEPFLSGRIDRAKRVVGGKVRFAISLDDSSIDKLLLGKNGLAFRDRSTVSEIEVELAELSLRAHLARSLTDTFPQWRRNK